VAKVKITTWVDERTAGVLRATAAQNEVSVSEAAALLLRRGVEDRAAEEVGTELLIPAVRGAVRREVAGMSDRLSRLLARSTLEAAATRRLTFQLLVAAYGADRAREMNQEAFKMAVGSMRSPAAPLRELLNELLPESGRGAAGGEAPVPADDGEGP